MSLPLLCRVFAVSVVRLCHAGALKCRVVAVPLPCSIFACLAFGRTVPSLCHVLVMSSPFAKLLACLSHVVPALGRVASPFTSPLPRSPGAGQHFGRLQCIALPIRTMACATTARAWMPLTPCDAAGLAEHRCLNGGNGAPARVLLVPFLRGCRVAQRCRAVGWLECTTVGAPSW